MLHKLQHIFFLLLIPVPVLLHAQAIDRAVQTPFILFPSPEENRNWKLSAGVLTTTTPEDITEETNLRFPSADFIVVRRLTSEFDIRSRLLIQVFQNHISLGIRWCHPLGNKIYFSVGDDVGFWQGTLKIDEFDTKGYGIFNYPNLSVGYRSQNNLLFTLRYEALLNMYDKFSIGRNEVSSLYDFYCGSAFTLAIEQPFYNERYLTLAFTALYTNFFWQTWTLYDTFDRNYFYPQISVGFIL